MKKITLLCSINLLCIFLNANGHNQDGISTTHQALQEVLSVPSVYAPWRDKAPNKVTVVRTTCPFCMQINEKKDQENFILGRYQHHVIALNFFPYCRGHVMILPHAHVKDLSSQTAHAREELIHLTSAACNILKELLYAQGINIGINDGKVAGASITDHLHVHIVPRVDNDQSFIQLIGKTEVIESDLSKMYARLAPKFKALEQTLTKLSSSQDHDKKESK